MKDRLNILFKPFVLIFIGLMVGYTFINWFLFIKLGIPSKDIVVNFAIPLILTALAILIFLYPKLKILKVKRDLYGIVVLAIISVPLIIFQSYIEVVTGEMTKLNTIKDIKKYVPTKYYTLKDFYIDKDRVGFLPEFEIGGKHNEYFNMSVYFTLAILENEKDPTTAPVAWLGVKYHETISNGLDPEEKQTLYRMFVNKSLKEVRVANHSGFVYLERLTNSDDKGSYIEAAKNVSGLKPNSTILIGVDEPFEARTGDMPEWIIGWSLLGFIIWLAMILIPPLDDRQLLRIRDGLPDTEAKRDMQDFLDSMIPHQGFFVTPILVYINVGIYLLMVIMGLGFFSFQASDLLAWGANLGILVEEGQWWRLLTCLFLHGGLMHLVSNMFGLIFVSIFLEPLLGRVKYLSVYLLTGIAASLTSIWWHDDVVSVGASGAIFGLYGVFLAFLLLKVYPPSFSKSFLVGTSIFVGINLLMGLSGGIDNAAHIGGLLSGFIIGLILFFTLNRVDESEEDEINH